MKNTAPLFLCLAAAIAAASFGLGSLPASSDTPDKATNTPPPPMYGHWRSSWMGGGGYIQNVVLCPSNPKRAYAYVDVGGAYRSDDGGKTWRMLHGSLPARPGSYQARTLIVDPRNDKNVLLALGGQWDGDGYGIYRSTDAGNTWTKTLDAPFFGNGPYRWAGVVLARDPRRPDVVVAASVEQGVFRSEDNGKTWKPASDDTTKRLYPTDIRFDPATPNRLWLCTRDVTTWYQGKEKSWKGAFLRSDDSGRTWGRVSEDSPSEMLQDTKIGSRFYGIFDGAIKASSDWGKTWQPFGDGLPPRKSEGYTSEDEFQSLAAGPDFVLTASTRGTFYRLPAGGTRWDKIERQDEVDMTYVGEKWFHHDIGYGWALGSIIIDPRNPNRWFFTDWFAIYRTEDAGKLWRLSMDGIECTVLHTLVQDPAKPNLVHLGMADNGYFRSGNGGIRFYLNKNGISNNIKSIAVSARNPRRMYATGPITWEWEANQVFISDDNGLAWTRSPMTGLPDMKTHHCNTIAVDPANPERVYLGISQEVAPGKGGVYKSEDGGKSWTWMGQGLPEGRNFFKHDIWQVGREIAVSPDGSVVAISRDHSQVFRWNKDRKAWENGGAGLPKGYACIIADEKNPGRFYLGGEGSGIHRSDDGGRTWKRLFPGGIRSFAVDVVNPQRLAAGTPDGIILSRDGGATWETLDRRLPDRQYNLVCFAGERLIAGSAGSGAFWMPIPTASVSARK